MFPWPQDVLAHNPSSLLFGKASALRRRSQNSSLVQRDLESFSNSQEMFVLGGERGKVLLRGFGMHWFTCDNPAGSLLKCVVGSQFSSCVIACSSFSWWKEASASDHCWNSAFCLLQVCCKSLRPGSAFMEKLCSSADHQSVWGQSCCAQHSEQRYWKSRELLWEGQVSLWLCLITVLCKCLLSDKLIQALTI